jgi:hypothetical protein
MHGDNDDDYESDNTDPKVTLIFVLSLTLVMLLSAKYFDVDIFQPEYQPSGVTDSSDDSLRHTVLSP